MKRLLLLVLAILAGCSSQPTHVDVTQKKRDSATVHTELGAGYFSRGQYAVALQELDAAVKSDPTYAPAYNVRGLVYMTLRENDKAEQSFERALDFGPRDPDINNNYGWFLCQTKREEESIEHFRTAFSNPLYATPEKAYLNAGICSQRMNRFKEAEKYYREALQIRSGLPQANLGLAGIYFQAGNYSLARRFLSNYMQMAEPTAESLWLGIRIEHAAGGSDAEADYAAQLKDRFPDSREAQDLMDGKFK